MKKIETNIIVYPFPCWITENELLEHVYLDLKNKGIEQEQFFINYEDGDFVYEVIFKDKVIFYE